MNDRRQLTRDGEPLHDRGTIDSRQDEADTELQDMEEHPPVDESDEGPEPVVHGEEGE